MYFISRFQKRTTLDYLINQVYKYFENRINSILQKGFDNEDLTGQNKQFDELQFVQIAILLAVLAHHKTPVDHLAYQNAFSCKDIKWSDVANIFGLFNQSQDRRIGGDTITKNVMVYPETKTVFPKIDIMALLNSKTNCNCI